MDTGYKVTATVRMTADWYGKNDAKMEEEVLVLNYPGVPITEAFDAVSEEIRKITSSRVPMQFNAHKKTLKTVLTLDSFMDVPSDRAIEAWKLGKLPLYQVEIVLKFTRIEEKRISNREFEQLKEKTMWDLETLRKLNGEETPKEETTEATEENEADKE